MTKPINPFVCGRPVSPQKFVGRAYEIDRIFEHLNCHEPGSVAISGESKIGKSSLLHYIVAPDVVEQRKVNEAQSVFIYQDCSLISPFSENNFWQKIIRKLYKKLLHKNGNPNLVKCVLDLQSMNKISSSDIEALLEFIYDEGINITFILILDEFEWCVRTDLKNESYTRNFLAGLRALITHESRTLSLVVATREHITDVCKEINLMTSPFENIFASYSLRPFSRDDAERLLKLMLTDNEITFTGSEKDLIYGMGGNHPLLLQIAASLVFNFKVRGASKIDDFLPIREQYLRDVKHQFKDFWEGSRPKMQQILVHLACGKQKDAKNLMEYWVEERDLLIDRGLIIKYSDRYRIFSPIFKEWLSQNLYHLGGEKWLIEHDSQSVKISNINAPKPPTVFISYSHKDEKEKEALMVHLGVLQKAAGLIDLWSDDRIDPGEDWEQKIDRAIEKAKAAVLLISPHFLTSEFILSKEAPKLRQHQDTKGLIIIPIITKPCAWHKIDWLARMNVWPKKGKPIWRDDGSYADQELAIIAEKIADMLEDP